MRLRSLFFNQVPSSYRAGHLLSLLLEREFNDCDVERQASNSGVITGTFCPIQLNVRERVKKDFLCHTTIAVFGLGDGEIGTPSGQLKIYHKGSMRRTGIGMRVLRAGAEIQTVAERLSNDKELAKALLPLDFVRFEIEASGGGWRAEIEHFGGSEVCMKLPPSQRYVPLGREQRRHLLDAFDAISRVMVRNRATKKDKRPQ